jgi:hypothetical protein
VFWTEFGGANPEWFRACKNSSDQIAAWWKYHREATNYQNHRKEFVLALKDIVKALFVVKNPIVFKGTYIEMVQQMSKYQKLMNKFYADNRGQRYCIDYERIDDKLNTPLTNTALVALNKVRIDDEQKEYNKTFTKIGKMASFTQVLQKPGRFVVSLRERQAILNELKLPGEIKDLTIREAFTNNFDRFVKIKRKEEYYDKIWEIAQEVLDKHGDLEDPSFHLYNADVLKMRSAITALSFDPQASSGVMYSRVAVTKGGIMKTHPTTVVENCMELFRLISTVDLENMSDAEYLGVLRSGVIHPFKLVVKEEFISMKKYNERRPRTILVAPFNLLIVTQVLIGTFLERLKHDVGTSGIAIGYGHTKEMLAEVVKCFEGMGKTVADDVEGMERSVMGECFDAFYKMPLLMMANPSPTIQLCLKNLSYMSKRKYVEVAGDLLLQKKDKMGHTVSGGLDTTCINSVVRNAAGRAVGDVKTVNTGDDGIAAPKEFCDDFVEDRINRFAEFGFKIKDVEVHEGEYHYCSAIVQQDGSYKWKSCLKGYANLVQDPTLAKVADFKKMYEGTHDYDGVVLEGIDFLLNMVAQ